MIVVLSNTGGGGGGGGPRHPWICPCALLLHIYPVMRACSYDRRECRMLIIIIMYSRYMRTCEKIMFWGFGSYWHSAVEDNTEDSLELESSPNSFPFQSYGFICIHLNGTCKLYRSLRAFRPHKLN